MLSVIFLFNLRTNSCFFILWEYCRKNKHPVCNVRLSEIIIRGSPMPKVLVTVIEIVRGTAVAQRLGSCATNRKVAVSIPNGGTMALGSTQPLTEMSKLKVKWSRYRPGVVQRVVRSIAVLFHDRGTRREWSAARPGRTLPPERLGTHFTGAWVGSRAGLDGRLNLVPTGIRSRTVQPVVSPYTDWATRSTTEMSIRRISWE